ncbi:TIGR02444 family protein [Shewanella sp. Isolate11]|uniref:TIGR02444 family protein n=1 Tax=Shewanella sp. Isolate11 TaxID=2908530 RepID=UPI001EFE85CA|nr:TIGR02444 family protein [Shewanella sp. Isolate11]MCG9697532.1 TIGR02444 family protein [Shewanella sp. Isolate11]
MNVAKPFTASLWQTCDQIYAQQQPLFINLQDEYGVNVNLLLLALWLDQQDYVLSRQQWQQLFVEIDHHDQRVLQPYRRLRKLSKHHLEGEEYQKMLEVELMLERKTQSLLLRKLNQLTANQNDASIQPVSPAESSTNLQGYLLLFGLDSSDYPQLSSLAAHT